MNKLDKRQERAVALANALYVELKPYIFALGIDEWLQVAIPVLAETLAAQPEPELCRDPNCIIHPGIHIEHLAHPATPPSTEPTPEFDGALAHWRSVTRPLTEATRRAIPKPKDYQVIVGASEEPTPPVDVEGRITEYLSKGGLWNPESMEHEKVRTLLMDCRAAFADMEARLAALQAFKEYVHKRLDDAGVPVDPPSPHRDAGCRIGGRLDCVLNPSPCGVTGHCEKEWVECPPAPPSMEPTKPTPPVDATLQRIRNLCPGCRDGLPLVGGRHAYADGSHTERHIDTTWLTAAFAEMEQRHRAELESTCDTLVGDKSQLMMELEAARARTVHLLQSTGRPHATEAVMNNRNKQQVTPHNLAIAWGRYVKLFGVPPHGTEKQLAALLSLLPTTMTPAEWEEKHTRMT